MKIEALGRQRARIDALIIGFGIVHCHVYATLSGEPTATATFVFDCD